MNLVKTFIAGIIGASMLLGVGVGASQASPVANIEKPAVSSSTEQVRHKRGHRAHRHHWRYGPPRHYRGPRYYAPRYYAPRYYAPPRHHHRRDMRRHGHHRGYYYAPRPHGYWRS